MESSPHEHEVPQPEAPTDSLTSLLESLGFHEDTRMIFLREKAAEAAALAENDKLKQLKAEYRTRAEEAIHDMPSGEYMEGQIAVIVAMAVFDRNVGDLKGFVTEIDDATEYAYQIGQERVLAILDVAPSAEIARLLALIGDECGFDEETVSEIAVMPREEALEVAYGYLTQAGFDAEEVLAPFLSDSNDNETE